MKANVGRYQRAPSLLELYGNGDQRLLGNPVLFPNAAPTPIWRSGSTRGAVGLRDQPDDTLRGAGRRPHHLDRPTAQGISRATATCRARGSTASSRSCGWLSGRYGRLVAQGTITATEDRSDNSASRGRQLPHHPRYLAYARPQLVRLPLAGTWEGELYADATVLAGDYETPNNQWRVHPRALLGAGAVCCGGGRACARPPAPSIWRTSQRLSTSPPGRCPGAASS